jgi:RimJ/RimL family protein N-acetyltransferase
VEITLVPVSAASLDAELAADRLGLAALLGATVGEWPPIGGDWDHDAVEHFRNFVTSAPADARLGPFYVIAGNVLVGNAGFMGPPNHESAVEIGYSICVSHRRCGAATATVAELCRRAPSLPAASVLARVRPDNVGSLEVLARNDFVEVDRDDRGPFLVLRRQLG